MSADAQLEHPTPAAVDAPSTSLLEDPQPKVTAAVAAAPSHTVSHSSPPSPAHHATESSRHSTPATSTVESIESNEVPQPSSSKLAPAPLPSSTNALQPSSPKLAPTTPTEAPQPSSCNASSSTEVPKPSSPPPQATSLPDTNDTDPLASIKPAYFYPTDANSSTQDGVPVFEPTMEQFKDFYAFCQAIDRWGMQAGIVKVVPPKEWRDALPDLRPSSDKSDADEEVADISKIRIRNAIVQHFTPAGSGVWRQTNITRTVKTWNAKQWADTCISEDQKGPEMDRMKWKAEVDGASNGGWGPKTIGAKDDSHPSLLDDEGVRTRSGKARPTGTSTDAKAGNKRKRPQESARSQSPALTHQASQEIKTSPESSPSKKKVVDTNPTEDWQNFDYKQCWLKEGLAHDQIAKLTGSTSASVTSQEDVDVKDDQVPSASDWSRETCREIESEYWRGLNFGKPPMYGADLKGSLFDHRTKDWNVAHLDNVLTRLKLRRKLPGVNTPYLYWGMWRATFAWHVEDMDLYSINYIHFGAPKQWYSIRQADRQRFESAMAGAFPTDSRRCPDFMRHKSYLASPSFLASHGIRPLKLVHQAGEFVITYPYGYHSGFNLGYNCAESVNFALESWLDIGRKANYCHCDQSQNSVIIDVDAMLEESKEMEELERKRELRRAKGDDSGKTFEEEELERRRLKNDKAKERRKLKKEQDDPADGAAASALPFTGGSGFYIDAKDTLSSPCVFCPADVTADLVPTPTQVLTDNNRLQRMAGRHAHRLCASFIPETWVGKQGKSDIVCGIEGIDSARFALKCQICPNASLQKLYPKIQCTRGKCPRSAHVSCALVEDNGWFIDLCANEVADRLDGKKSPAQSVTDEDDRLVVLCRPHNPLFREAEEARKAEKLRERVSMLPVPSMIKIRTPGGMYEALMVEIRETEDEVVIEDEGNQSTVKFQNILFESKATSTPKEPAVKAEPTPGDEERANKRLRRASRKAVDIAAAAAAAENEDDGVTSSSPIAPSKQETRDVSQSGTAPAGPAPKTAPKPRAPRPPKAKKVATPVSATPSTAEANANFASTSVARASEPGVLLRGPPPEAYVTQEHLQYQKEAHERMQHYQQVQHRQQQPYPHQQAYQQHPYYSQAVGQSGYGSQLQSQDSSARYGQAPVLSAPSRSTYQQPEYTQHQQHYSSPEYPNRHPAYTGYASQMRADSGAGQHAHYGHPAAAYHGATDRAPPLPTYAKPLAQQPEHRYGTLPTQDQTPTHAYGNGGYAPQTPYGYASYQYPQAAASQQQHVQREQAKHYGHYPAQYARHAAPYEYEQMAHHMPAHYATSTAQTGHYQRP